MRGTIVERVYHSKLVPSESWTESDKLINSPFTLSFILVGIRHSCYWLDKNRSEKKSQTANASRCQQHIRYFAVFIAASSNSNLQINESLLPSPLTTRPKFRIETNSWLVVANRIVKQNYWAIQPITRDCVELWPWISATIFILFASFSWQLCKRRDDLFVPLAFSNLPKQREVELWEIKLLMVT
jgi:hypothetical protein